MSSVGQDRDREVVEHLLGHLTRDGDGVEARGGQTDEGNIRCDGATDQQVVSRA